MGLVLITPPPMAPVTLAEVKAHLRVDTDADDTLLASLIATATSALDGVTGLLGRALVQQQWRLTMADFPDGTADAIALPLPPAISVDAITYETPAGETVTLATSAYRVLGLSDPFGASLQPVTYWPATSGTADNVQILFTAGFSPSNDSPPNYAANVPAPIRTAILQHVALLYGQRESVLIGTMTPQQVPGVSDLLGPWRMSWW